MLGQIVAGRGPADHRSHAPGAASDAGPRLGERRGLRASGDLRRRTLEVLETARPHDHASKACDWALGLLIAANVAAVILESVPALASAFGGWFAAFETFSVAIFSLEFVLRVWSCTARGDFAAKGPILGRLRYVATPMAMIDLLAILPFYLAFFVAVDLRFMRALRLLRLFKLTRYSTSMSLLLGVLREEARPICAALFILMLLVVMTSSFAYLAEHAAQPAAFGSIPDAMWWAVITLTTVGYGDVTPVTAMGKVLAGFIGVIGIGMVALPAGLLASGFNREIHDRRLEYERLVEDVLDDQHVTAEENAHLGAARETLGLGKEEARAIFESIARSSGRGRCPHCAKSLDPRRGPERT